jgi:hypothetical protein
MITKKGIEISKVLSTAGLEWQWEDRDEVLDTLSLICRHTVTYTRLHEIMAGNDTHSGEWVNANWAWLEKRDAQLEKRLEKLGRQLAIYCSAGKPVLELKSLYGVTVTVTDANGIPRTRDMGE